MTTNIDKALAYRKLLGIDAPTISTPVAALYEPKSPFFAPVNNDDKDDKPKEREKDASKPTPTPAPKSNQSNAMHPIAAGIIVLVWAWLLMAFPVWTALPVAWLRWTLTGVGFLFLLAGIMMFISALVNAFVAELKSISSASDRIKL